MPPQFNWNNIETDDDFRRLAGSLLLQVVSKHVAVFGRPGRDYGIDASFDGDFDNRPGKWVFQFKKYGALSDLKTNLQGAGKGPNHKKGEIELVLERLAAKEGTPAFALWTGVRQYRLLTNIKLLGQQRQDLLALLKPIRDRGLEIDVWDGEKLERLADCAPYILQQFFGTEPPLLVPFSQFHLEQTLMPFGDYLRTVSYVSCGREEDFAKFLDGSDRVLLLLGTGGIGKTRVLLELGAKADSRPGWTVLATQKGADSAERHLDQLPVSDRCLVIIDDADRLVCAEDIIRAVNIQLRFRDRVKLVLACRNSVAGPLEREAKRYAGANLPILTLARYHKKLDAMAKELGMNEEGAAILTRIAKGVPLWVVLGSEALKAGAQPGELSRERTIEFHLERYLSEVAPTDRPLHRRFLDVLAALEPLNIEDERGRAALAALVETSVPRVVDIINEVKRAGFIEKRGRFLRLTPDLVSDYILGRAFVADGIPTDFEKTMLSSEVPDRRNLIVNLSRAESITELPLLDSVAAQARIAAKEMNNASRLEWLATYETLAYIRPAEYLEIVSLFLANPQPDIERAPGFAALASKHAWFKHQDVLAAIPKGLKGVLRWREHRSPALEILATIADDQREDSNAPMSARRVILDALRARRRTPIEYLNDDVSVLERWREQNKPGRINLIKEALKGILAIEYHEHSMREEDEWVMEIGRLSVSRELIAVRTKALSVVQKMLASPDSSARIMGLEILGEAWRQVHSALSGEEQRKIAASAPVPNGLTTQEIIIPASHGASELGPELSQLYSMAETLETTEQNNRVLAEIEHFASWGALYAEETDPYKTRAIDLTNKIYSRPQYRLFAVIGGKSYDEDRLNRLREEIIAEAAAEENPVALIARAREAMECDNHDLGTDLGGLLFEVTKRSQKFGSALLDKVLGGESGVHVSELSEVLIALRLHHGSLSILFDSATKGGPWRKAAIAGLPRLYSAVSAGILLLSIWDFKIMEEASASDPWERANAARFLRTLASQYPELTLRTAEALIRQPLHGSAEDMAQALLAILKHNPFERPRITELVEAYVEEPALGFFAQKLILSVAKSDPVWLVVFFEKRLGILGDEHQLALPHKMHAPLAQFELEDAPRPSLDGALARLFAWHKKEDAYRENLGDALEWFVGNNCGSEVADRLQAHIANITSARDCEPVAAAARILGRTEGILRVIGKVLVISASFSADEKIEVRRLMYHALAAKSHTSFKHQVPEELLAQERALRGLGELFPEEPTVQEFVREKVGMVRATIEEKLRRDEELGIA